MKNTSIGFLLKKPPVLPKLMLLKVDQYQLNRWACNQCLRYCNIHYFKTLKEKSCSYVQKKIGTMLWFDDWNKAWWECTYFCCVLTWSFEKNMWWWWKFFFLTTSYFLIFHTIDMARTLTKQMLRNMAIERFNKNRENELDLVSSFMASGSIQKSLGRYMEKLTKSGK